MDLFINERTWNKYAKTIAIEDIHEECNEYLPEEYDNIQEIEI